MSETVTIAKADLATLVRDACHWTLHMSEEACAEWDYKNDQERILTQKRRAWKLAKTSPPSTSPLWHEYTANKHPDDPDFLHLYRRHLYWKKWDKEHEKPTRLRNDAHS